MAVSEARQTFWVEPPNLNEIEKKQYKTLPPEFVASGVEFDAPNVDKIIGEYRDGRVLFYFARFQDGIAHKVRSISTGVCLSDKNWRVCAL